MRMRKEGGPAFPRPIGWNGLSHHGEHCDNDEQEGMSLRDYFAAAALQGLLANMETCRVVSADVENGGSRVPGCVSEPSFDAEMAHNAYLFADAMIAYREKTK